MTTLNDLRWKKFPVLNDGFVCLVDAMGGDASVVQAARVSYGKDTRDEDTRNTDTTDFPTKPCNTCGSTLNPQYKGSCNCDCIPELEGPDWFEQQQQDKDRTLIRYLMRHRHTTPFEMAELKFLVRVPMDCWRQWIRHRTANVNEYSTRYTEAIDSQQTTAPDEWRLQSGSNKQGSSGYLEEWPEGWGNKQTCPTDPTVSFYSDSNYPGETPGSILAICEKKLHQASREVYQQRLDAGIAREQARKDLPLSTYTEAYWKIDLHNLLHFLSLRMDSHAQLEIRQYATTIGEQIVKPLFPVVWEAFQDYRLNAMFLTALDIKAIETGSLEHFTNKREREECVTKLNHLGLSIRSS